MTMVPWFEARQGRLFGIVEFSREKQYLVDIMYGSVARGA